MTKHSSGQGGGAIIWLMALLVLLGAVIGGVLVGYWVLSNVDARLVLADQPLTGYIPDPLKVTAKVTDNLEIALDTTIHTQVPVDQMLTIPVKDALNLIADFDGELPISMNVRVKDQIELNQLLDVDTVIEAQILGDWHKLPIRGKIPVKAIVPINLVIPVNQNVRIKLHAPVKATIKDDLHVPLKTVIDANIPIQSKLSVPVLSDLKAIVTIPRDPLKIVIDYADLRLPLRTLKVELTGKNTPANPEPESRPEPDLGKEATP